MLEKTNNKKNKKVLNEHIENKPRKIEQIKNKLFTKKATKPTKKEGLSDVELAVQKNKLFTKKATKPTKEELSDVELAVQKNKLFTKKATKPTKEELSDVELAVQKNKLFSKKAIKPTKEELSDVELAVQKNKLFSKKATKPTELSDVELAVQKNNLFSKKATKPTKKEELSDVELAVQKNKLFSKKAMKPTKEELSNVELAVQKNKLFSKKATKPTKEELSDVELAVQKNKLFTKKVTKPTKEELSDVELAVQKNKLFSKKATKPTKEELSNVELAIKPTEEELSDVELALQKLWKLDKNRLNPKVDYTLNLPLIRQDDIDFNTEKKLFESVSKKIGNIPTYQLFYQLLDNYIPQTGIPEEVDDHELKENKDFIEECLKTGPMIYTYNYLKERKIFKGDMAEFEKELHKIWFDLYKRDSDDDSSAFEHIFVGEVRNGAATAFHNWITFYFYEKSGKIDYEGFMPNKHKKNKDEEPDPNSHVVTIRFTFEGAKKPYSTSFIGTSPEFELAIYTLLFYLGEQEIGDEQKTKVTFDGVELNIKIYTHNVNGRRLLKSAFPSLFIS